MAAASSTTVKPAAKPHLPTGAPVAPVKPIVVTPTPAPRPTTVLAPPPPTRPRWTPARWFLVIGSFLPILYLTVFTGLAWLHFGPIPYIVVPMALIGLAAIWWPNRWMLLVAALLMVFLAVGSSQGDPGFLRPDRFLEYTFFWLEVALAPAMLVAAIVNIRQQGKDGRVPAALTPLGAAALAVVVALWVGGVATAWQLHAFAPAGGGEAVGIKADLELNLTAEKDLWQADSITVAAGKVVKLTIVNKDVYGHVFNQDDIGLAVDIPAGGTVVVWFRMPTAGTFQFYCVLHAAKGPDGKWAGMVGTLTAT
ncbi:MAG TPA: cupredoxin domain-containing protein [Candidatus Thermoplasmatota archaeon]|nr:cupredoxin domain-containing protein [Candidatus Thermoplasmatota archaeon]